VFSGIVAAVASTAGLTSAAKVTTVYDFETDSAGNKIKWGQVIDNEYAGTGLTISASNPKHAHSSIRQNAVIIDTKRTPVSDFRGSTWNGWHPGNAIIIPDNGKDSDKNGYFDRPEPVRSQKLGHSGSFFFDFSDRLEKVSFYMMDVDRHEVGGTITAFQDGRQVSQSLIVPAANGDRGVWHHITGSSFDRVVVTLGGSAAIGEIRATSVPTPSAALAGVAMLGAALLRRRSVA
jgi:hypothetical protein